MTINRILSLLCLSSVTVVFVLADSSSQSHASSSDSNVQACIPESCLYGVARKAACGLALQHDPVHKQLGVELTEAASKGKNKKQIWCGEMVGSIVAENYDVAAMAAARILDLHVEKDEDPIKVLNAEANKSAKKKKQKKVITRAQAAIYLINAIKTGSFQSAAMQAATVYGHTDQQGPAATEIMQYKDAHHPLHIIATTAGIICNNGQGELPKLEHGGNTCSSRGELQHVLSEVRAKRVYKKRKSHGTRGLTLHVYDDWSGKGELGYRGRA